MSSVSSIVRNRAVGPSWGATWDDTYTRVGAGSPARCRSTAVW